MRSTDAHLVLEAELIAAAPGHFPSQGGAPAILRWSVHNRGDVEVLLFDGLYDRLDADDRYAVDPQRVVVTVRDGAVGVAKRLVPVPDLVYVEVANLPCVTPLAPGARLEHALHLALPLRAWSPYDDAGAHPPAPATHVRALPLNFEIGYALGGPAARAQLHDVATPQGRALRFDAFGEREQRVLSVGPLGPCAAWVA